MALTKEDKVLISKLQSDELSQIMEVLKDLNTKGSVVLIPYLFDIIASGKFESVENDILRILSNIKEKDAAPIIMESLQHNDYKNKTADVVAICWQSSLDFSPFLPVFSEFFFINDYQTSIEAFTVIEEFIPYATLAQRKECLKILEKNSPSISSTLKPLYNELYKLVKNSLDLSIDSSRSIS